MSWWRARFTDRLTGLHNYDYFAEAMRSELARVRRYGGCVTLVMLDLDRFKSFNDQHGHAAGNRLLNGVGQAIARGRSATPTSPPGSAARSSPCWCRAAPPTA